MTHTTGAIAAIFVAICFVLSHSCTPNVPYSVFAQSIILSDSPLVLMEGEQAPLVATILPEDATDKTIIWSSSDESVVEVSPMGIVKAISAGTAYITASNEASGKSAGCEVTVVAAVSLTAIDLGLSVKWADCNLGADKPVDYGGYYAWGETAETAEYSLDTYKWYDGSDGTMTKYCVDPQYGTVDNLTVLEPADDAAHVRIGRRWRMPTDGEWEELLDNCSWTWTDNCNGTGVSGYIVNSKKSDYMTNSIFLPAAGYRNGADLSRDGTYGYYWSSSLYTVLPNKASFVYFNSGSVLRLSSRRYSGQSVRPVFE